jgi:hypothetical protein
MVHSEEFVVGRFCWTTENAVQLAMVISEPGELALPDRGRPLWLLNYSR